MWQQGTGTSTYIYQRFQQQKYCFTDCCHGLKNWKTNDENLKYRIFTFIMFFPYQLYCMSGTFNLTWIHMKPDHIDTGI